jgi:hypothetical protein
MAALIPPMLPRPRPPEPEPSAAQVQAAERLVQRGRRALSAEQWQRLVRCTARAIARRECKEQQRAEWRQSLRRTALRGPTFDARRAAANDLED